MDGADVQRSTQRTAPTSMPVDEEQKPSTQPAVARAKNLIPRVLGRVPADVVDITADAIASQRVSPEGQEGLKAFLDKRQPSWIEEP